MHELKHLQSDDGSNICEVDPNEDHHQLERGQGSEVHVGCLQLVGPEEWKRIQREEEREQAKSWHWESEFQTASPAI